MINFLREYLKINTAQPNPDYQQVIALFTARATNDDFLTKEFVLPSGNSVLVITYAGSDQSLPALALNHHMDVVPAENLSEWICPPFAATMQENLIIGRGTQDMKSVGIVQYEALKELKENNMRPARTIHLLCVPDEERGGYQGTQEFLEHPEFSALNIGFIVDEGIPSGNEHELHIKVEERTPIQIRVTSTDRMGHASQLFHPNCLHNLIRFLSEVIDFHAAQQKQACDGEPGKFFSSHITSMTTENFALNVIPHQAQATIDFRVPAQCSLNDALGLLESMMKKHPTISYEILATSKERFKPASVDSALYKALSKAIQGHGIKPKPFAFEATTDARFYSNKGIEGIGLTPFTIAPNLHGTNESVRVEDLILGKKIFVSFLRIFCEV